MMSDQEQRKIEEVRKRVQSIKNDCEAEKNPSPNPSPKKYPTDGPCRETASTILAGMIHRIEKHLEGLRALDKMFATVDVNSPAEITLFEMLQAYRNRERI